MPLEANEEGGAFCIDQNGIYRSERSETIDYPETGNDVCFQVEATSFWFQHRNQVILSMLKRFEFHGNFADIGGGNGYQASCIQPTFPDRRCYLIEPGYRGCLNAKSYGVKFIYNCMAEDFDFRAQKVGGIGLFDVLEHIEDDVGFLASMKPQLARGTNVYLTVPAYQSLWTNVDVYAGHHRRYTARRLDRAFAKAGFQKMYSSYFFSYIPIPLLLLRKLPEYLRRERMSDDELLTRLSGNLTRVRSQSRLLKLWHSLELQLLSKYKIWFGGSLVGVYKVS